MPSLLPVKILTAQGTLFSGNVLSLHTRTSVGEITILPLHTQLITPLQNTEVTLDSGEQQLHMHVAIGVLEVSSNHAVTIFASKAELPAHLNETALAEHIAAAEQKLAAAHTLSDEEVATVAAQLERNLSRLKFVRKHSRMRPPNHAGSGMFTG